LAVAVAVGPGARLRSGFKLGLEAGVASVERVGASLGPVVGTAADASVPVGPGVGGPAAEHDSTSVAANRSDAVLKANTEPL
jgi:hypothetical protein